MKRNHYNNHPLSFKPLDEPGDGCHRGCCWLDGGSDSCRRKMPPTFRIKLCRSQRSASIPDSAAFPCSQCADLIASENEVADGIVAPSASRLPSSVARLHAASDTYLNGTCDPAPVSIIRGSLRPTAAPSTFPYPGPSHRLSADLGRFYPFDLRRTDSGVLAGNRHICWDCPTWSEIIAAEMESGMLIFQDASGRSLDGQDVPDWVQIFKPSRRDDC